MCQNYNQFKRHRLPFYTILTCGCLVSSIGDAIFISIVLCITYCLLNIYKTYDHEMNIMIPMMHVER